MDRSYLLALWMIYPAYTCWMSVVGMMNLSEIMLLSRRKTWLDCRMVPSNVRYGSILNKRLAMMVNSV